MYIAQRTFKRGAIKIILIDPEFFYVQILIAFFKSFAQVFMQFNRVLSSRNEFDDSFLQQNCHIFNHLKWKSFFKNSVARNSQSEHKCKIAYVDAEKFVVKSMM